MKQWLYKMVTIGMIALAGCGARHTALPAGESSIVSDRATGEEEKQSSSPGIVSKEEWGNEKDAAKITELIEQTEESSGKPCWYIGKPMGTYTLEYGLDEQVQAPFATFEEESQYEEYGLLRADGKAKVEIDIHEEATAAAYCERADESPVTVLFSTDKGKSWTRAEVEVGSTGENLDYHLFCEDQATGYLSLCYIRDRDDSSSAKGGMIYGTEDSGKTWEQIGTVDEYFSIWDICGQNGNLYLAGQRGGYPHIMKSENGTSWKSIHLPVDTAVYQSGQCSQIWMEGNYGIAEAVLYKADPSADPMWEQCYFATKDNGNSWMLWEAA